MKRFVPAFLLAAVLTAVSVQAALCEMHVIHPDGLFNFSLKSRGWFESPMNDRFFFNIVPEITMILEDAERNTYMSVSRLDAKKYASDLDGAYEKIMAEITSDKNNYVFLKNNYEYNGIKFRDILYKDKNDLSNMRVILARDAKKTPAAVGEIMMILFYYPKKADFTASDDEVNTLLKTFMFRTELPEPVNDQLLGKGADCAGEFISLNESLQGNVTVTAADRKRSVLNDPLIRIGQVVETRGGKVSFKLNDGSVALLNESSRIEFISRAESKFSAGEMLFRTQQINGKALVGLGNYLRMEAVSGEFRVTIKQEPGSNMSVARVAALAGGCQILGEKFTSRSVAAGEAVSIEFNDLGKFGNVKAEKANAAAETAEIDKWASAIRTHKVYEALSYLDTLVKMEK